MPLSKSKSEKAFHSNIKEMVKAGHPVKQADPKEGKKMNRGPNKGPQGKDDEGDGNEAYIGCQEEYEEEGHKDVVTDIPSINGFDLKAPEDNHTPNFTKAPKGEKIGWNFQHGRGNGGIGI
jgi:hypothetical protein